MRFIEYVRLLSPYTASASYTLPELATICFDRRHVYASDGISSLSIESCEGMVRSLCVKAGPLLTWCNSVGDEFPFAAGILDGQLKIQSNIGGRFTHASFPTAPTSTYRLKVDTEIPRDKLVPSAYLDDSMKMADALTYALKRSGTDSTFKWAAGVTLSFDYDEMRVLMTDNITMAVGGCAMQVESRFTCMITHSAAQRLQALCASYAGEVKVKLAEGKLFVQVNDAVFSTVTVQEDEGALENFYSQIEPYADMETFDPGPEFIDAVRRHGQFAGRDGAATLIQLRGSEAILMTSTDVGRTKDRVPMGGEVSEDVQIYTGASVLSRLLQDGATFALTEEAIVSRDRSGNMALLCAWDEEAA
jgi:hypothetical protein